MAFSYPLNDSKQQLASVTKLPLFLAHSDDDLKTDIGKKNIKQGDNYAFYSFTTTCFNKSARQRQ